MNPTKVERVVTIKTCLSTRKILCIFPKSDAVTLLYLFRTHGKSWRSKKFNRNGSLVTQIVFPLIQLYTWNIEEIHFYSLYVLRVRDFPWDLTSFFIEDGGDGHLYILCDAFPISNLYFRKIKCSFQLRCLERSQYFFWILWCWWTLFNKFFLLNSNFCSSILEPNLYRTCRSS